MEIKIEDVSSKNKDIINISFSEKEITCLIGSNECSSNELINLICGNNSIETNYYLKENSEGMLFNINIKEDIKYYLGNYDKETFFELIKNFYLDISILDKCYIDLSSSEKKKILLIIGLMIDRKIIIFENPTSKLDIKGVQALIKNLKKLKRESKTIIITSYNTDFILEVSDRIIVVNDKRVIGQGNRFDILSNKKLLDKINLKVPNTLNFVNKVKDIKKINMCYRDNINDLIKDIYRYAK